MSARASITDVGDLPGRGAARGIRRILRSRARPEAGGRFEYSNRDDGLTTSATSVKSHGDICRDLLNSLRGLPSTIAFARKMNMAMSGRPQGPYTVGGKQQAGCQAA